MRQQSNEKPEKIADGTLQENYKISSIALKSSGVQFKS